MLYTELHNFAYHGPFSSFATLKKLREPGDERLIIDSIVISSLQVHFKLLSRKDWLLNASANDNLWN